MRKLLLAMVMVLSFALPAWAGPALIINGALYPNAKTIEQDGMVYVPAEVIAQTFGAEVTYDGGTVSVKETLKRPPIYGEQWLVNAVNEALDLLEKNDRLHYVLVCENVTGINLGNDTPSKIDEAYTVAQCWPNGQVFLTQAYVNDERIFTPIGIAGTLVHEGTHALQDKYGYGALPIAEKEVEAYNNEILALMQLGAPTWMIETAKQMGDSYLQ